MSTIYNTFKISKMQIKFFGFKLYGFKLYDLISKATNCTHINLHFNLKNWFLKQLLNENVVVRNKNSASLIKAFIKT